ncbi:MAG: decarboxylating 6-phosphogluconate dehydrogenase [Gammaproteobacteria bacterium]|nr:decarboxylating 6-phosphogluconate dehydrogenase [Gammaproteobacteria bacterium]
MQLGMIGLGRMGGNMVRRLRRTDIHVVAYDRDTAITRALADETGCVPADTLEHMVEQLATPRALWLMLPAGEITERQIVSLAGLLTPGDIVIDGANSHYKDSMRRAATLSARGLPFIDAGVSGGIWGLAEGYALMVGGAAPAVRQIEPVLKALAPAPDRGWLHCGPVGAGHFVKMVHNGIEYGMMQSYAEGLALLEARDDFSFDLAAITEMWRHGSVVRSWLLDLTAEFLAEDASRDNVAPYVADSGEGRWAAIEAVEQGVPAPVMSLALMMRFASQGKSDYAARLLALMRQGFGGHGLKPKV